MMVSVPFPSCTPPTGLFISFASPSHASCSVIVWKCGVGCFGAPYYFFSPTYPSINSMTLPTTFVKRTDNVKQRTTLQICATRHNRCVGERAVVYVSCCKSGPAQVLTLSSFPCNGQMTSRQHRDALWCLHHGLFSRLPYHLIHRVIVSVFLSTMI